MTLIALSLSQWAQRNVFIDYECLGVCKLRQTLYQ